MGKELFTKDTEEYERTEDELNAQANVHGLGMWDKPGAVMREDIDDIYGLCASCTSFFYCRREFGEALAMCERNEVPVRLSAKSRMVECSNHTKRSMLSLAQMMDIAWKISVGSRSMGFT
jgi:hypothetical protein